MKRLWGLVLLAGLAGCGDDSAGGASNAAMQAWVGKDLSALEVQTLDGQVQKLTDAVLFTKKPVIVNVWATWCPPCLKEMPTLDALGKQGEFTVVAIATDQNAADVKDFLKKQAWGSGVQVWFDSLGAVTRAKLGAVGLPVTYVLDPSLTVRMVEAGERNWAHAKMVEKVRAAVK